jgi:hypothetical protein
MFRHAISRSTLRRAFVVAVAGLVAGCATKTTTVGGHRKVGHASEHAMRERAMNERWRMRHYSDLLQTLGTPKRVMAIPGGGNPPSFAVVYGLDPATGCIDAFAVTSGENPVVRDYHCR